MTDGTKANTKKKSTQLLRGDGMKAVKIYVDMDGVLADFDTHFFNLYGFQPQEFEKKYGEKAFWDKVYSYVDFFAHMPPFHGHRYFYNELLRITPHVIILSSPSKTNRDLCIKGKLFFLKYHMTNQLGETPFAIFESRKYLYACPNSILIDDYSKKIDAWNEAGGIGILHSGDYDETLKKVNSRTILSGLKKEK